MLHFSRDTSAWLHLAGWDAPPTHRDAVAALRQIETQTDDVVRARGEPEHTPFVLIAGSIASETAPHRVRKVWRLAPELADRLLSQVEQRSADEAIHDAIAQWDEERTEFGDDTESLDLADYVGVDFADLAARAYPPPH
jgi:hypothetical protein